METKIGPSSAAAAATSVRPNRRALYRRSNTLSSLPLDALQVATTSSGTEHRRPLEPIADLPEREAVASPRDDRMKPRRTAVPRQGRASEDGGGKPAQFCRKTSCNDLLISASSGGARPLYPAKSSSGMVSSTSGRLLTKVKERIRDTVLQTTPEWPAVMQERRQRAAIQFEMQAAKMMVDEQRAAAETATPGDKAASKCTERKSFATTVVDRKEAARAAFRRSRSVSCEDAVSTMLGGKLHPASAAGKTGRRGRRGSPNSDVTGIICSSKDFQSIIELSRQEIASDEITTSPVHADKAALRCPSPGTIVAPVALNYQELSAEPSPGRRQRPAGDDISESVTAEVHVECPDAAAASSVSEAVDNDRCSPMSLGKKRSDDVAVSLVNDSQREAADACGVLSRSKPPEVVYDADGQTWEIYGAELDPEVLGNAIQRHLQCIMSTTPSVPETRSQVTAAAAAAATAARTPSKDSENDHDVSAAAATDKRYKSSDDDDQTERQRNFIHRFLQSVTKRRSFTNQGSMN